MLNFVLKFIYGARKFVRLGAFIVPLSINETHTPIDRSRPNIEQIEWYALFFALFEILVFYAIYKLPRVAPEIQASERVFTQNDITIRGIPALTKDNELSKLIERLVSCFITADTYRDPVIASDLHLYDNTDSSYKEIIKTEKPLSSYSREPLESSPFPFAYNQMKTLCDEVADKTKTIDDVIKKLADLTICPVTKEIMKAPKLAYLIYTDSKGTKQRFVSVCDQKALDLMLPSNFELIKKRDFSELQDVIEYVVAKESKFANTFKVLPEHMENTSDSDPWTKAFETCKNKFTSTPLTPTSVGRNPHAIFAQPIDAGLGAHNEDIRDNHMNAGPR